MAATAPHVLADAALAFLQALGKDPDSTYFRSIASKGANRNRRGADLLGFDANALIRDNINGEAIYFVTGNAICATGERKDKEGRLVPSGCVTDADCSTCPLFFVEWDDRPIEWQVQAWQELGLPEPSTMVSTGGKSIHCYWTLQEPIVSGTWERLQRRLLAHCEADPRISNPSRVMRLPGFGYIDKATGKLTGKRAEVIHTSAARYTVKDLEVCLPHLPAPAAGLVWAAAPSASTNGGGAPPRPMEELERLVSSYPTIRAKNGQRDEALALVCGLVRCMEAIGHSTADAIAMASRHHPQAADTFEQVESWNFDAYSIDSFIAQCRKAGVDVSRHDRRRNVNNNVVPLRPQQQPEAASPPDTLDSLLGPAEDGKLRRPRTDKLTCAVGLVLPLCYNLLTNRIEHNGETIHGDFLTTLYLDLAQDHGMEVAKERAIDAGIRVARLNAYHPVRDYLNGLSEQLTPVEWAALDLHCFGSEDASGWGALHLQRQLIGLVARALEPGCELHTCLVLQSDQQGIGKSTFWKILGGPWFSDSLGDLRDVREDRLQLHSAWIHEWGEIDSVMGKRESETLKRFITSSRDDVRKPYGRGTEQLLRSCGLVGTTNRRDFIKDPTGNRRFPIIQVRTVNLDWVKENRDRIWGSAVAAYRAQEPWHYNSQEALVVSAAAMDYAAADPLRDALESWAEDHPEMDELPIARILHDLPEYWERRRDRELMRQVGLALTSLGWANTGQRIRYLLPDGSRTDKATLWKRP